MSKDTGAIIKELRQSKGITQEQLAEIVGVQKSAIAKYENGRVTNLKRPTIAKMADYFGVKPSYIMGMDDTDLDLKLTTHETQIILYYRKAPENVQKAVELMLGLKE